MMPDSGRMVAHILSVNWETLCAGSVHSRGSLWNKRERGHYNASACKSLKTRPICLWDLHKKSQSVLDRSGQERLGCGLPPHSAECLWLSAEFPLITFS